MAQKKKDSRMMGKIIKTAVSGVLCVALAGGMVAANVLIPPNASSVQSILGLKSGGLDNSKAKTEGINMEYGKPGFDTEDALVEDEIALNKQIAAEGIVLLKNNEGRMPYSTDTTFSFVSHSAVSYIGGNKVDMKTAFEDAGFGVNEDLWKFYSEGNGKDYGLGAGSVSYGDDEDFSVNECPLSAGGAGPDRFHAGHGAGLCVQPCGGRRPRYAALHVQPHRCGRGQDQDLPRAGFRGTGDSPVPERQL